MMSTRPSPPFDMDDNDDALIRQNAANVGVESSNRETEQHRKGAAGPIHHLLPIGRGGHGSFHLVLALATTFVTAQVSNRTRRSLELHDHN